MQVLGMLKTVIQKDGLVLECAAKEYLRRDVFDLDKSVVGPDIV